MTIGTSIVLIAVGLILYYAVEVDVGFIDLQDAGLILAILGVVGLILSLLYTFAWADRRREREVVEEVPVRRRERF